jgi:hypothetical protein
MFGAPLGGTVIAGQYGFDCAALGSFWPLKGCGGFGRYLPSIVIVAPGDPGVPVFRWAPAGAQAKTVKVAANIDVLVFLLIAFPCIVSRLG